MGLPPLCLDFEISLMPPKLSPSPIIIAKRQSHYVVVKTAVLTSEEHHECTVELGICLTRVSVSEL